MNNNPKDIILEVLTIIGYEGDKEQSANDFLQLVSDQAILNMIDGLESARKAELQEKVASVDTNSEEFTNIAKDYFSEEDFKKALSKASEKLFADYLQEIVPTLSEDQQNKLFMYLGSLAQPQTA